MKTMKMKMAPRSLIALAVMWLAAGVFALWPYKAHAESKLDGQSIETKISGVADFNPTTDGPVFVEFAKSPALSARLTEMLQAGGFQVTSDKASAKSVITMSGELVLVGGPVYFKGVKVSIGEATEKTLATAQPGDGGGKAAVVAGVSTLAINAAAYAKTISPALHTLQLSRMADVLGEASGAKGWFNTKVAGDPRGICLSRCEDWKKVKQSAYVTLVVSSSGVERSIRVQSLAVSEVVAPDEVIEAAVEKALLQIKVGEDAKVITASR